MAISLEDLALLIDVADTGSFSQAAARRGWSQPQVSQRVAALEVELGSQLFRRHRRGARPTPACEAFLPSARRALDMVAEGRAQLAGAPSLSRVTLASLSSLAPVVFPPLLAALNEAPMEIHCDIDHSQDIMRRLLEDSVQVGFLLKCPPVAGIQMEPLWRSPIVAVVAAGHPLAAAQELSLRDVADLRIAPQYWGSACDELVQRIRTLRATAQPLHTVQPASAARELVLEHGFLSFMPEITMRRELAAGRMTILSIIDQPASYWEIMVAYRAGKRPDPGKERVLAAARSLADR